MVECLDAALVVLIYAGRVLMAENSPVIYLVLIIPYGVKVIRRRLESSICILFVLDTVTKRDHYSF
jgi:hypothetical protein